MSDASLDERHDRRFLPLLGAHRPEAGARQRMLRPSRLVGRLALQRRLATSDHARPVGCASSFHYPHRPHRHVVSRLSASGESCVTTAITGMPTRIIVTDRISAPIRPKGDPTLIVSTTTTLRGLSAYPLPSGAERVKQRALSLDRDLKPGEHGDRLAGHRVDVDVVPEHAQVAREHANQHQQVRLCR